MRTVFALILTTTLLSASIASFAAADKIAVMDFPKILKNSPQMDALSNKLKKEFKPRQDKIIALQKTMETDQSKLKRDASVMSEKDMLSLREKIANNQRDLRRLEEDYLADARASQKKAMGQIVQKVNKLVKKVAEQGNYDLILQKEYVAFASGKIDITDEVIKELAKSKS